MSNATGVIFTKFHTSGRPFSPIPVPFEVASIKITTRRKKARTMVTSFFPAYKSFREYFTGGNIGMGDCRVKVILGCGIGRVITG